MAVAPAICRPSVGEDLPATFTVAFAGMLSGIFVGLSADMFVGIVADYDTRRHATVSAALRNQHFAAFAFLRTCRESARYFTEKIGKWLDAAIKNNIGNEIQKFSLAVT